MSVFTLLGYTKAQSRRSPSRQPARDLDQQCVSTHKLDHTHDGVPCKTKYRCQWKMFHAGKHMDFEGREWS